MRAALELQGAIGDPFDMRVRVEFPAPLDIPEYRFHGERHHDGKQSKNTDETQPEHAESGVCGT